LPANADQVAIDERRQRVIQEYTAGKTMHAIARDESVSVSTISRDVAAVREQWREDMNHRLEIWKDRELDRIDRVEMLATASFERSLAEALTMTTERTTGDKTSDKAKVEKKHTTGDAKFLRIMLDCVSERCRILGLYAPKQTDFTSGGAAIKVVAGIDLERL